MMYKDKFMSGVAPLQGFAEPIVLGLAQSVLPFPRIANLLLFTQILRCSGKVTFCSVPKNVKRDKESISPFKSIPVVFLSNKGVVFIIARVEVVRLRLVEDGLARACARRGHVAPGRAGRRALAVHVVPLLALVVPAHEEERHPGQVWRVQPPLVQLDCQPVLIAGVAVLPLVVLEEVADVEVEVGAPGGGRGHALRDHRLAVVVALDLGVAFDGEREASASCFGS
mmetsp:Transcript_2303/g.3814  ORF Transcript_2303/g.3814 Transcript_2303/m.3814 type:complete len:226 (-) Transcript_2303:298-975(-)